VGLVLSPGVLTWIPVGTTSRGGASETGGRVGSEVVFWEEEEEVEEVVED
jgi:hypothetical protein